jgi:hypothetical protein
MDGVLRYEVGVVPGKHYCCIRLPKGGGFKSIPCASVEEAKAAAQADYERRILSAITPAPDLATEQQSVKEAAREAIVDEIEEIISETHEIDVTDRNYAENIVGWLERHHPAALRSLAGDE